MQGDPRRATIPRGERAHLSVVVPVYNNEWTLGELVERLTLVLSNCCPREHEIVLVDDGSTDRSWHVINDLAGALPRIVGVQLSRNFGQHAAISAGIAVAEGELTAIMDADLEHRPEDLPVLMSELDSGADLVVAVDEGRARRATSVLFQKLYGRLSRGGTHPKALTYRVMSPEFKDALLQYGEVDVVLGPIMSTMGFAQRHVAVTRSLPMGRKTSYSLPRRVSLASRALLAHATLVPATLGVISGVMAAGLLVFAVIVVGQSLLLDTRLPSGLTVVLVTILVASATILGSLAFLSYVAIAILREVKARPRFHIARSVGRNHHDDPL